jgi:hypothetical protein
MFEARLSAPRASLLHRKEVQGSKGQNSRMVKQAIGIFAIALALPAFAQQIETVELAKLDPDVAAKLTTATIRLSGATKTDIAYSIICARAGLLDVIFDPRFESQKMWVDFRGLTLFEALELVRRQSHTAWRVVAPHTIVVVREQSIHPNPPDPLKQNLHPA